MRWTMLLWAALLVSSATTAQMGPPGSGGGNSRGGHGGSQEGDRATQSPSAPRPPKPLKREKFDKVVTAMFRSADTNRDGIVTFDELQAVIEGRRETLIHARFMRVDRNHNGSIDLDEFSAWQREMGSVALSEAQATGGDGRPVAEIIEPEIGKGPDDRILERLIEPLSAIVIVNANVNYDAGVSLDELLAYEGKRFDAADKNHDGEISMDEARDPEDPEGRRHLGDGGPGGRRPPAD